MLSREGYLKLSRTSRFDGNSQGAIRSFLNPDFLKKLEKVIQCS